MPKFIIDQSTLDDIRDTLSRVTADENDSAMHLRGAIDLLDDIRLSRFPSGVEKAPTTMEITTESFVQMHQQLADVSKIKDRVIAAMRDVYCFTPTDSGDTGFITEAYLYETIGKDDARSILGLMRGVSIAVGADPWVDVEQVAARRINAAILHRLHIKFETEEDGADFAKQFRAHLGDSLFDGDPVPRIVYHVDHVTIDPPREEFNRMGEPFFRRSEMVRDVNRRVVSNLTNANYPWVMSLVNSNHAVVEKYDRDLDQDVLYPND